MMKLRLLVSRAWVTRSRCHNNRTLSIGPSQDFMLRLIECEIHQSKPCSAVFRRNDRLADANRFPLVTWQLHQRSLQKPFLYRNGPLLAKNLYMFLFGILTKSVSKLLCPQIIGWF